MDNTHHTVSRQPPDGAFASVGQTATLSGGLNRPRWQLPDDVGREKRAIILALFVGVPALLTRGLTDTVHPLLTVGVALALIGIAVNALVAVRRIPRLVLSGLMGGGAAGLVAFGAGSRLAMRIVALTGGRSEVTVEGTVFLLIAGAMAGAFLGPFIAAMIRIWKVRGSLVGAALTLFPGSGLLLGSETRTELLHEGAGGWVNIPMFLALFAVFGILVVRAIRRADEVIPLNMWGSARLRDDSATTDSARSI